MKTSQGSTFFKLMKGITLGGTAVMALFPLVCQAVDGNWNVNVSSNWSTPATNWTSNPSIPGGIGSTVGLTFDITGTRTITIDGTGSTGSRTVGILNIGDPNGSNAYTLARVNANDLTFNNGASAAQLNQLSGSAANTISTPVVLGGSVFNVSNASMTLLTISGGITATSGTNTLASVGSGTGGVTFSGGIASSVTDFTHGSAGNLTISTNAIANSGNLTFSGTGASTVTLSAAVNTSGGILNNGATTGTTTISGIIGSATSVVQNSATSQLTLSGVNTFNSGVTLNSGTLSLNNDGALGTGTFTINGGTLTANAARLTTNNNVQAWNGDFSFAGSSTLNLGTGAVTISGNRTLTNTASAGLTVGGTLSGSGNLTINPTSTGSTTFSGGLGNTGDLTISGSNTGAVTFSSAVNNVGKIATSGLGTGAVTFSGGIGSSGTDFTHGKAGNLTISTNPIANVGNLTFSGTGTSTVTLSAAVDTTGAILNNGTTTGTTTITGTIGSGVSSITQNSATSSLSLSAAAGNPGFSGPVYVNSGSLSGTTGGFGTGTLYLGDTTGSAIATIAVGGQSNPIVVRAGSTGALRISMSNTSGSASFTGPITLNRDLVYLQPVGNGNHGWNSAVSGAGDLIFSQAATGGDFNTFNVSGALNQTGDIISIGTGTTETRLASNLGPGIKNLVQNSPTSALTVTGNNASFIGNAVVQTGTLLASGTSALNANNVVQVDPGATFQLGATTLTIAGLNGAGNVTKTTGASRTLTIGGSGSYDFSGIISNSSETYNLIKTGTGTQTLRGANTYNGAGVATRVADGTLRLAVNSGGNIGSLDSANILTLHGGNFSYDGTGSTGSNDNSQSLASLTVSKGSNTITNIKGSANSSTLTFGVLNARASGATANFAVGDGTNGTNNKIVLTGQTADSFLDRGYTFNGSNFAYNDVGGYVRGVNWGVDPGSTTSAGGSTIATTSYAQITGDVTAQTDATFTALNILNNTAGARNFTLDGGSTVNTNAILVSGNGGGTTTISGDIGIRPATAAQDLIIRADQVGDILNIASDILNNSGNALVKTGDGTLILSGTDNALTGQTFVTGGVLEISSNVHLGRELTGAQLNLNNGTLRANGTFGLFNGAAGTNNRAVRINNTGTFDVTGSNTLTVAGVISDNWTAATTTDFKGTLVKTGTGSLLISGANTYNGSTLVQGGTLTLASSATIANTPLLRISNGATLDASALSGGFTLTSGKRLENAGRFKGGLTIASGAVFAPGNSPGNSQHDGNLTLNTGSFFEWELIANSTSGAGTNFDEITFTSGGLTIQSGVFAHLNFDGAGSTVNWNDTFWDSSRSWLLFSGGNSLSTVGSIFNTAAGEDSLGQSFFLTGGSFSFSSSGNDVFLNYAAVPEPSAGLLLVLGMGIIWLSGRGKRSETPELRR